MMSPLKHILISLKHLLKNQMQMISLQKHIHYYLCHIFSLLQLILILMNFMERSYGQRLDNIIYEE